jgi:hypothetical protein
MLTGLDAQIRLQISESLQGESRAAANSVFIKLWLDVKHSTINHYFALVVN